MPAEEITAWSDLAAFFADMIERLRSDGGAPRVLRPTRQRDQL